MNQALIFYAGQQNIWSDDPLNLYNQWSNANDTARALGAHETGAKHHEIGWEPVAEWEFPDGSKAWIAENGGSLDAHD